MIFRGEIDLVSIAIVNKGALYLELDSAGQELDSVEKRTSSLLARPKVAGQELSLGAFDLRNIDSASAVRIVANKAVRVFQRRQKDMILPYYFSSSITQRFG